jgi:hypothetical protein
MMTQATLREIVNNSKSKADVCKTIWGYVNSRNNKKLSELLEHFKIETSHFDGGAEKHRKYEILKKTCPVCSKEFKTLKNKKEKKTCSHACANSYFRSGINNPNWRESAYRSTCFKYHKKECIICGEFRIVDVHHLDGNKKNNIPENLVPLCRTHHAYWHSRYKNLIKHQILQYIKKFKETLSSK